MHILLADMRQPEKQAVARIDLVDIMMIGAELLVVDFAVVEAAVAVVGKHAAHTPSAVCHLG